MSHCQFMLSVLPNTELNDEDYREKHGIEVMRTPMSSYFTIPGSDEVREYMDVIMATKTLPHEDLKKTLICMDDSNLS